MDKYQLENFYERFPANEDELNRDLKKLKTDEDRAGYINLLINEAKKATKRGDHDIAMEDYEALGLIEEAKKSAERGVKYFQKRTSLEAFAPGQREYFEKQVQRYNDLLAKKQSKTLDNKFKPALIVGTFLCSLIFLSSNITGNTILNSPIKTSNILGASLFIIGVVASFLYSKKRKVFYSTH